MVQSRRGFVFVPCRSLCTASWVPGARERVLPAAALAGGSGRGSALLGLGRQRRKPTSRDNPCPDAPPSDNFWVSPFAQPTLLPLFPSGSVPARAAGPSAPGRGPAGAAARQRGWGAPGSAGPLRAPRGHSAPRAAPAPALPTGGAGGAGRRRRCGARGGARAGGGARGAVPALGADSHMPPCLKRLRGAGGEGEEAQTAPQPAPPPPRPGGCRGAGPAGRPRGEALRRHRPPRSPGAGNAAAPR